MEVSHLERGWNIGHIEDNFIIERAAEGITGDLLYLSSGEKFLTTTLAKVIMCPDTSVTYRGVL